MTEPPATKPMSDDTQTQPDDASPTDYADLAEAVQSDPHRETIEKETTLYFAKPDDRMQVNTAERALMRRLLNHPHFELDRYETSHGDRNYESVSAEEYAERDGHDARKPVYSVTGTLPVGTLKVSKDARKSGGHANVIAAGVLD